LEEKRGIPEYLINPDDILTNLIYGYNIISYNVGAKQSKRTLHLRPLGHRYNPVLDQGFYRTD